MADDKYFNFLQDIVNVYGLIHQRYITTPNGKSLFFERVNFYYIGLAKMFHKFLEGEFGVCPRALCDS